jgi:hypothetical protein
LVYIAIIVFVIALFFTLSEGRQRKLNLAMKYHELGENSYLKGDYERSKVYFEAANIYRENAYKNMED